MNPFLYQPFPLDYVPEMDEGDIPPVQDTLMIGCIPGMPCAKCTRAEVGIGADEAPTFTIQPPIVRNPPKKASILPVAVPLLGLAFFAMYAGSKKGR